MSDPFIGEVRIFANSYVIQGWLACDGTECSVGSYQALYAIIGNTFGGTYPKTFKVPDLRTLAVAGSGAGTGLTPRTFGNTYGEQMVGLDETKLAAHTHIVQSRANLSKFAGRTAAPSNTSDLSNLEVLTSTGAAKAVPIFEDTAPPNTVLHPAVISPAGGVSAPQPHNNVQPYQALQFFIAWDGIYPAPE